MARKVFTPEEIIARLREAEKLIGGGSGIDEVCRKLGVSRATYYRWKREYSVAQADLAAELEKLPRKAFPLAVLSSGVWMPLDFQAPRVKKVRGDRRGLRPVPKKKQGI